MWTVVSGVIVLFAAQLGARPVGGRLQGRPAGWYVAANVAAVAVAVALVWLAYSSTGTNPWSDAMYGAALGLGFGCPAGLRQGYKSAPKSDATKGRP